VADAVGNLTTVAREGETIRLSDGSTKTISSLLYWGATTGGDDDVGSPLSDAGQVAFVAFFTDGTSAVVVATLPSALPADANNDNVVDFEDFLALYQHFGKAGDRTRGDFDYDGFVDFADFQVLELNFGKSLGGAGGDGAVAPTPDQTGMIQAFAAGGTVPEPGGLTWVAAAGACLLAGRSGARQRRGVSCPG
jgi:hypothetical protein